MLLLKAEWKGKIIPALSREGMSKILRLGQALMRGLYHKPHSLGQARRLGDEILFLSDGRLAERASVDAFFKQPQSSEAASFLRGELP